MEVSCKMCGHAVVVETWTREYEKLKSVQDEKAYVCRSCQEKLRVEAARDQR